MVPRNQEQPLNIFARPDWSQAYMEQKMPSMASRHLLLSAQNFGDFKKVAAIKPNPTWCGSALFSCTIRSAAGIARSAAGIARSCALLRRTTPRPTRIGGGDFIDALIRPTSSQMACVSLAATLRQWRAERGSTALSRVGRCCSPSFLPLRGRGGVEDEEVLHARGDEFLVCLVRRAFTLRRPEGISLLAP